MMVITDMSHAN